MYAHIQSYTGNYACVYCSLTRPSRVAPDHKLSVLIASDTASYGGGHLISVLPTPPPPPPPIKTARMFLHPEIELSQHDPLPSVSFLSLVRGRCAKPVRDALINVSRPFSQS